MKHIFLLLVLCVAGCATDHAWDGERSFRYCAICFDYDEKANTSLKAQAPQDKQHAN